MSVMEEKPARTRRSFIDEFKGDAVAMVLDDGNRIVDVARRLGTVGPLTDPTAVPRHGTSRCWP